MPEEKIDPSFENIPVKKPQLRTKKIATRPAARRRTPPSPTEQRIDSGLASIYQNENGRLPDMKKIDIKRRHPVLGFIVKILIIGSLMAFAAWIGFFVIPTGGKFTENQVSLSVEGPTEVGLGATTTYKISYQNTDSNAIDNAILNLWYPDGFIFVTSSIPMGNGAHNEANIGTVQGKSDGAITITGLTYSSLNQSGSLRVSLKYQPKNIASTLQKSTEIVTKVISSPYTVNIEAPDKISAGTPTEITYIVKNTALSNLPELHLLPNLPGTFTLSSTTPALDKDKQWIIKATTSTPATSYTFKVRGTFSDDGSSELPITGTLSIVAPTGNIYQIATSGVQSNLVKTGAIVSVAVNGSLDTQNVAPGNTLNYTINVKNTSATEIKNLSVLLAIDGPSYKNQSILKWSAITDAFDGDIKGEQISDTIRHGQITWNQKKIPALASLKTGEEVNIDVQLPVKTKNDVDDLTSFSESKITNLASISYTDASGASKTAASAPLVLVLNSDLGFEARDTTTEVNGAEQHTINWILTNTFHPLKNITLSATVFGDGATVTTSTAPAGAASFDSTTKKLTWTIPEMPGSVDVLAWPFTITLSKKNPTQNTLVSKVTITATDAVTGQTITLSGKDVPLQ